MSSLVYQSSSAELEPGYNRNGVGVFVPDIPVLHRDHEYDSSGFDQLLRMQREHFWYLGRHRFLLAALKREFARRNHAGLAAVDLGGGCGGWIRYLLDRMPAAFSELALADSSLRALELAGQVLNERVKRFQVDLLHLHWHGRWDAAFLLDVLEHIPQDADVLRGIGTTLKPGGLLFVTTPALSFFWSYNDEAVHHVRRYSRADFKKLAVECGLRLQSARYFNFLLSPLLLASRWKRPPLENMSAADLRALLQRTHATPRPALNRALQGIFSLETPLGHWIPFPWGTSILGVFRKEEHP